MSESEQDTFLIDYNPNTSDANKIGYIDHTTDTRFTSTGVKRIYLNATNVSYDVGAHVQVAQQPAKPSSFTHNQMLPYGDFLGYASPTIKVQGIIALQTYDLVTGLSPTQDFDSGGGTDKGLIITLKLLQQIYQSGHLFRMWDYYDYNELTGVPTNPIYRVHSLDSSDDPAAPYLICTGMSANVTSREKEGEKLIYNITFREVRNG